MFFLSFCLYYEHKSARTRTWLYERPVECSFVLDSLIRSRALNVLDVGSGTSAFPALLIDCGFNVVASDYQEKYWKQFYNRHIYVIKDDITRTRFAPSSFDAITCISVLEHIQEYDLAVAQMVKLLRPSGGLILTFPYTFDMFCENVYDLPEADALSKQFQFIARSFSDQTIQNWITNHHLTIENQIFFRGWEGKFWRTGKQLPFPTIVNKNHANGTCILLKKAEKNS
jgi:SAM-dependent methyltransferase